MTFTLKAARVNAGLTQAQAAEKLTDYFGMAISRQRVMKYEANPEETPIGFAKGFADIYGLSVSDIVFLRPQL